MSICVISIRIEFYTAFVRKSKIKDVDCLILDKSYIKNKKIQSLKIKKYFYTIKNKTEFIKYNKKNNLIFENL